MNSNNNKSKALLYLVVIIAFFILIFITKDMYAVMQEHKDSKNTLEEQLEEKQEELNNLNSWRAQMKADKELDDSVNKFLSEITDHELYRYIYDYVEDSKEGSSRMSIKNITISEGTINEFGLKEGKVNITAIVSNEKVLLQFIDYLIRDDSRYNFYLNSFSYPNDNRPGSFSVSLPLTILYK